MTTTVELVSPSDSITFNPAPDAGAPWVYDNATLDAWYKLAPVAARPNKRPNAHGAYGLGQIFTEEHRPILTGQYYGVTPAEALAARNRLTGFFADGMPVVLRVTDELGTTSRQVWLVECDAPFRYDFSHFPFDIVFVAPDPRRYSAAFSDSSGMPTAGGGLAWNLGGMAMPAALRRNLFPDPRGTSTSADYWGTPAGGVYSLVTDMPGDVATALQWTCNSAGATGIRMVAGLDMPTAAAPVTFKARIRSSLAVSVDIYARPAVGSATNQALLGTVNLIAGVNDINLTSNSFSVAPSSTAGVVILAGLGVIGHTMDVTKGFISPTTGDYFDGDTDGLTDEWAFWEDEHNGSASRLAAEPWLFWDWGEAGVGGIVQATNTGSVTTFPRIEVGGAGSFVTGFRVTEIETGRELTFTQATSYGDVVVFDSRTQRATIGAGDVTGFLSSRDWFSIPPGETRRYQIAALGAVDGSPTITLYVAPAYM